MTGVEGITSRRIVLPATTGAPFSLETTCGPVAWAGGRWPNVDWTPQGLVWVGWEGSNIVWRITRQVAPDVLAVTGSASPKGDTAWTEQVLGMDATPPSFNDPVPQAFLRQYPGLRPFAAGSLFDGIVTSIVGQSISIAAAAVTEARLSALFAPSLELQGRVFRPLPRPDQLADATAELIRRSGVTWRRAAALVEAGRAQEAGQLPASQEARADPDRAGALLRRLPLVGPWTVESALLWGIGLADAYPTGDVALLRAARLAYGDATLSAGALDQHSERWRPFRAWAARLLWTNLLGAAPTLAYPNTD